MFRREGDHLRPLLFGEGVEIDVGGGVEAGGDLLGDLDGLAEGDGPAHRFRVTRLQHTGVTEDLLGEGVDAADKL